MKYETGNVWFVFVCGLITSAFFLIFISVFAFEPEINERCPMSMDDAFGRSFDQLRNDCLEIKTGGPAPALTCGQLRLLSVSKVEEWPEGVVASEVSHRHCLYYGNDTVTGVSDINSGQYDGVWLGKFVFEDDDEFRCKLIKPFEIYIDNGSVNFAWLGRNYRGAITNNSWVLLNSNGVSPRGVKVAIMGPVLQPEVYHSMCGKGYLQMNIASEGRRNVPVR